MASMVRFPTTIKVGNPRLTRRAVRSSVEFYKSEDIATSWQGMADVVAEV